MKKGGFLLWSAAAEAILAFVMLGLAEDNFWYRDTFQGLATMLFVICAIDIVIWLVMNMASTNYQSQHLQDIPSGVTGNRCPGCGLQLGAGVTTCPRCSRPLRAASQPQAKSFCTSCGHPLQGTEPYCPGCGTKQGEKDNETNNH